MSKVILFILAVLISKSAFALGVLGTPNKGSTVSGVGVISGYNCDSKDITVYIDGESLGKAGAGTRLLGTYDVCGHTETGYSLLYNFNNLTPGQHSIHVTADGVTFDSGTFYTIQSGGTPWLSGVSSQTTIDNFPVPGKKATLVWYQSYQNFLITQIQDMVSGTGGAGDTVTLIPGITASFVYDPFTSGTLCKVTMTATNNSGSYITNALAFFTVMVNGVNTGDTTFIFFNVPNGQTASSQTLVDRSCGTFSLVFDPNNGYIN